MAVAERAALLCYSSAENSSPAPFFAAEGPPAEKGLIPSLRPLFAELLTQGRYFSRSLLDSILLRSGELSL
ncbi:hypothetical protein TREAZ_1764 [Leadbettera azotonutricia ZAS-9]|uniref:Uncharacterized protein n=1 Tax=Leadbettera azotonutricia (strain ATCC BAA-888 / DSM 13862 / ZAS-9) TaxID=545695 RepID=F5YC34_LEAAZ|nr:hypothetical protein TREAZ_1764 [Leadbettera azotonutricia ZAS-9]